MVGLKSIFFLMISLLSSNDLLSYVQGDLYTRVQGKAGSVLSCVIPFENPTDNEVILDVAGCDLETKAGQGMFLEGAGHHARSARDWLELESQQIKLAPKSSRAFHCVIRIPEEVSMSGSYWAAVLIEPANTQAISSSLDSAKVGIQTKVRYCYQVCIDVDQGSLSFKVINTELQKGGEKLFVDIQNVGTVLSRPTLTSDWFDEGGRHASRIVATAQFIYPNNSCRYVLDTASLKPGQYSLILLVDAGDDGVFGDRMSLRIAR